MKKLRLAYALLFCGLFFVEFLIALFVHDNFIRPYLGDVLVTVLICSFLRVFIPKGVTALPAFVLLFATIVEVGQYFDFVKLIGLENNPFVSVLLGRTFSVADILCYAVGCCIFFVIDRAIFNHLNRC